MVKQLKILMALLSATPSIAYAQDGPATQAQLAALSQKVESYRVLVEQLRAAVRRDQALLIPTPSNLQTPFQFMTLCNEIGYPKGYGYQVGGAGSARYIVCYFR